MELGQRLRQARLDAGLTQRQVCGDLITRNMLSQIENGTAQPSMDTLCYLAEKLGKPVGYFLDEQTAPPNQLLIEQARAAFTEEDYDLVLEYLNKFQQDTLRQTAAESCLLHAVNICSVLVDDIGPV